MKIHMGNGLRGIPHTAVRSSEDGEEKTFAEKIAEELKRLKEAAEALQVSERTAESAPAHQAPSPETGQSEEGSGAGERKCDDISDPAKAMLYHIKSAELFLSLKDVVGLA